jgi:Ca2+-binding RTX toxin-like protein
MPYTITGTTITVSGSVNLQGVSLSLGPIYEIKFAAGGADVTFHSWVFIALPPQGKSYTVVGSASRDILTIQAPDFLVGDITTMHSFSFVNWSANDLIFINGSSDGNHLTSSYARDTINGFAGNDFLDGGDGDTLRGGIGDDTYDISRGTIVDERSGNGIDTVKSHWSVSLLDPNILGVVENVVLTAVDQDTFATGNALSNRLVGGLGNNTLNGMGGADIMQGRRGNDTYVVDNSNDVVDEAANMPGGIDTVRSSVSFRLSDTVHAKGAVENLVLVGAAVEGEGNALGNTITGNARTNLLNGLGGNDVLDGAAGADQLQGGAGMDTYVLGSEANGVDKVVDSAGGADTIRSSISRSLSFGDYSEIENLTLLGTAASGLGNGLANLLTGNAAGNGLSGLAGSDKLVGGAGGDRLIGGLGADQFVFNGAAESRLASGRDMIVDFSRAQNDKIILSTIDANTSAAGNQAFTFIGAAAFSKKAGELRFQKVGTDSNIEGDIDGDGIIDLFIASDLPVNFVVADFVL